ncbi:MAG: hypothetical protein ACFFD2_05350 [Promethearchaeota archaeon]
MFQAEILPIYSNQISDILLIAGRQKLVISSPDFEELICIIPNELLSEMDSLIDALSFHFAISENKITIIPFTAHSESLLKIFRTNILNKLNAPSIINFSLITELLLFHRFANILSFLPAQSKGYLIHKYRERYYCQYISPPLPQNLSAITLEIYEFLLEEEKFHSIDSIRNELNIDSYHKVQKILKNLVNMGQLWVRPGKFNKKQYKILNQFKEEIKI